MNFTVLILWPYPAHGRDRGKSGNRLRRWCESLPRQAGPAVVARPARGRDLEAGAPWEAAGNPRPEHLMAAPSFAVLKKLGEGLYQGNGDSADHGRRYYKEPIPKCRLYWCFFGLVLQFCRF
jgi:hypothetical protein